MSAGADFPSPTLRHLCARLQSELAHRPPCKVDPYLQWGLLTCFEGFAGIKQGSDRLAFAVELHSPADAPALAQATSSHGYPLALVPAAYIRCGGYRHCTARVRLDEVVEFLDRAEVARAQLGLSRIEQPQPGGPLQELDLQSTWKGWSADTPLIAVIDHGIGFLHRNLHAEFTPAGMAPVRLHRLVAMWDQWQGPPGTELPVDPWEGLPGFGYGRLLRGPDLQRLALERSGEAARYERLGYRVLDHRASHGTAVLDLAAGNADPLLGVRPPADRAAGLPVAAVQLPWRPEKDVSGGSLCVHVLDALHFVCESFPKQRQIIVNLSDGALAGSHTGSSILEEAMDDLLARCPGLCIVLAAGNAYREQLHVAAEIAPAEQVELHWRVLPDDRTESFLELWIDPHGQLEVELCPPGLDDPAFRLVPGQAASWADGGAVIAGGLYKQDVPIGRNRQLALLALRPTRRSGSRAAAPHGQWTVRLHNRSSSRVCFDAWIERDDPPFPDPEPRRQSRFVDSPVARHNTLNSIATGAATLVVGGYRLSDDALARYSAAGSICGRIPTVVAPSDEGAAMLGVRVAGSFSGSSVRMNGTSVAAPVVTRIIANALAVHQGQFSAAQLAAALRRAAQVVAPPADPEDGRGPAADGAQRSGGGWIRPGTRLTLP